MKNILFYLVIMLFFASCKHEQKAPETKDFEPVVSNNGTLIAFADTTASAYFKTEVVSSSNIGATFSALGKVGATVLPSNTGASQNIVLFENPNLASNYTQLIQHQINIRQIENINIKQKQIELARTQDLQQHGAATGQDLLNAQAALSMEQTNLANEKASLIEHEAQLKAGGFNPDLLFRAKAGAAYIICDIPENQLTKIKDGSSCNISFSSFPNQQYTGKIEEVADVVDNTTRMIKIRVYVNNSNSKIKSGMFANVSFGLNEGNAIALNKNSIVTIQGNNYAFVKISAKEFERKTISIGPQIGDKIIVFGGLGSGENVVVSGVMQLKGLSFGY